MWRSSTAAALSKGLRLARLCPPAVRSATAPTARGFSAAAGWGWGTNAAAARQGSGFPPSDARWSSWRSPLSSPARAFSSGGGAGGGVGGDDSQLAEKLQSEVRHEKESYSKPEALKQGPPAPFKADDKSGAAELVLRRGFEGEDIEVKASVEQEPSDEEEPEDDAAEEGEADEEGQAPPPPPAFPVTVSISKSADKPPLVFDLLLKDAQWYIAHVKHSILSETAGVEPYEGPDFATLDVELQQQFEEYLYRRGIDSDLAAFLQDALLDKEQKEYVRWLDSVAKFVSS